MVETYVLVKDNKIVRVYETGDSIQGAEASCENEGLNGELFLVPTPFEGSMGQDKREYTKDWKLRSLEERVLEGYVKLDPAEKIENGEIRLKTLKESIDDGTKVLRPEEEYSVETNSIVIKPWAERIKLGISTYEGWLDKVVRPHRDQLLSETDLVYCNPERWWGYSDSQKHAWSAYKQELRDFPSRTLSVVEDPSTLEWPEKPV